MKVNKAQVRQCTTLCGILAPGKGLILMHEIVGHAVPIISGNTSGDAVKDENKVRAQLNIQQRYDSHSEADYKN